MTDLILLATLMAGPQYGYHLKRQAGLILGQGELHNNLVYPLLRRFLSRKWVTKKAEAGKRGQVRQQYSLTALGRKELLTRLSSFTGEDARVSNAFRLRVGMFQMLEPEARIRILKVREQFLRTRVEKLRNIQANFDLDHFAVEVTSRLVADSEAEIGWIGHLRRISKKE